MQETFTKVQFWAELDALGEDEVRVRLITKRYGDVGAKKGLADEWLRKKDQDRAEALMLRSEAINLDNLRTAKSAKNAAWAAAIIAAIAVILSIVTIYLTRA